MIPCVKFNKVEIAYMLLRLSRSISTAFLYKHFDETTTLARVTPRPISLLLEPGFTPTNLC